MLLGLKIFARSVYKVEHMFSRVLAAKAFFFGDVLIHILSLWFCQDFCLFLNDF